MVELNLLRTATHDASERGQAHVFRLRLRVRVRLQHAASIEPALGMVVWRMLASFILSITWTELSILAPVPPPQGA